MPCSNVFLNGLLPEPGPLQVHGSCCNVTDGITLDDDTLKKSKCLSEFVTLAEKALARKNLGIPDDYSLKWGYIKGDIVDQQDLYNKFQEFSKAISELKVELSESVQESIKNIKQDLATKINKELTAEDAISQIKYTNPEYPSINSAKDALDRALKGVGTVEGAGIPIYDQEDLDSLGVNIPDKYITIPNKYDDLKGSVISREIQQNGTYVDILFSAIRKLQSEVAKIRNSFLYGMYSYTGTNTAMSRVVNGIQDPDSEPLWAIEESDLSLVNSTVIGAGNGLTPEENVNINTEGVLKIQGTAQWDDTEQIIKNLSDPKLFCYITSSTLNIQINLFGNTLKVIDLSKLNIPVVDVYNIMVLISRKSLKDNTVGENYIYISIGNATRSQILKEGFFDLNQNNFSDGKTLIDNAYYVQSVVFTDLDLSKLDFYSKYQDFSNQVIPSAPTDEDYKYKVAHITVRSVRNEVTLQEIKEQLPNNELIFVENTRKLWIKNNNQLIAIGSGGGTQEDSGMTETEIINLLKDMGIVKEDGGYLQLSDISDITFINQDTNNKYKFYIDSEGNLRNIKLPNSGESLIDRVTSSGVELNNNVRGFIGQLRIQENNNIQENVDIQITQDARIYADRIKIGAFYAPLDTDKVFGCSRAFVELENTADCDFNLQGCYLHFTCPNNIDKQVVYHLPLTGTIPAGGTYLIVGKQYSQNNDSSTQIKVDSFDQEWFVNGELVDFTVNTTLNSGYGFALTYGNADLSSTTYLYRESDSSSLSNLGISSSSKFPYIFDPSFIDAIYFYRNVKDASSKGYWADMTLAITSNTMYRNMFELDPAKQAFQACNTADSSRTRWQSANDVWIMDLSKPIIQFPHSDKTYTIQVFSPKASFEHKNVQTDKSKLNMNKPNMVYCSFGTNIYTDRCFNWISAGVYDEYVWIRKKGEKTWTSFFESYKEISKQQPELEIYPRRKEYSVELNNAAYARIINRFPADNTQYTAHKCIITITEQAVASKAVYEYIVGRAAKDGSPDIEHCSDIQTFVLCPDSYKPVIYQITDQQGFHWVEYQVWAAAAKELYDKIKNDQEQANIIPIIINTGDVTQNGTRISEWLDYYEAGKVLFKEYEHMAVVGNNDLCNTNVNALGTGDDQGKSNSFYFQVFNCYDIDESVFKPIVNGKYIPSLYFFDSKDYRFVNVNSEITIVNCQQWFNLVDGADTVNIYTGFTVGNNKRYINTFTPIYTMLYNILDTDKESIVSCHEMPFTVITNESIANGQEGISRSISKANALVGSHLNQISVNDTGKGTYWFSRLLEYKKVKLVLGGHKHTYACTYPLREYFLFGDGKNSRDNYSEYVMEDTLENDNVTWIQDSKDLTKFPLTKRTDAGMAATGFYPYTPVPELTGGVTYFMCQATGYKLTSNKELPSANQKFSLAIPQTNNTGGKDTANDNQKYPMFSIIKLDSTYQIYLVRIANIFDSKFKFAQNVYSTEDMKLQYFSTIPNNDYGQWGDTEELMLEI